jgi:LmbE family N-acetylglucosaminyl deacetylase
MMTSGDGFPEGVVLAQKIASPKPSDFRDYGLLREGETRAAMQLLGVDKDHVTFLGYPDEGLCHLASTYLFDKTRSFLSPYSERTSPPVIERLVTGVSYRGVDIRRELEAVVAAFAPTLILLPHPEDDHPDHCSTHIFVREALSAVPAVVAQRVRVLHYLIHFEQWPLSADAGTGATLNPPADFPPGEGRFVTLALTPGEAETKRRALLLYSSQMQAIGRFMTSFARDNELFIEGDPAAPPECWCDGSNVATEAAMGSLRRKPPLRR